MKLNFMCFWTINSIRTLSFPFDMYVNIETNSKMNGEL